MDWQHWDEVDTKLRTRTQARTAMGMRGRGADVRAVVDPRRDSDQAPGQDYRMHILLSTLMLLLALVIANLR